MSGGRTGPAATGAEREAAAAEFDPVLLVVMSNAIQAICREMTNTMQRAARSSVLATGRDFSCSIVTADDRLLDTAEALPIHALGSDLLTRAMGDHHDDLAAGDAFLHNDPYLGNTHHADHTILAPVFVDGVHVFTTCAKGHQADIGNARPSTYMGEARDVYEEGALSFPCVRIQRAYRDVDDIVRMCRRRIRVPDIWYGDYLAALGAARVGERALEGFVRKHGADTVRAFFDAWFGYSERRMAEAIAQLPAGRVTGTTRHDPFPGVPDGVPLKVDLDCDPEHGRIAADLRDNPDCVPAGINTSEATARAAVLVGIFNALDPSIPHNSGSMRRVDVLLRRGCVAGIPEHPTCCSLATTNVTDRIISMTQAALARHAPGTGLAEGPSGIPPTHSVIYGRDGRHGGRHYITQLLIGTAGGPASARTDGWLSYLEPVTAGVLYRDSVEVLEQKYPIVVECSRIRPDSEGAGARRGGPGAEVVYGPLHDELEVSYTLDGMQTPAQGVHGGLAGATATVFVEDAAGRRRQLTEPVMSLRLQPGERIGALTAGGGGYGAPGDRDTDLVLADVRDGLVSHERARSVYGAAIEGDARRPETLAVRRPADERES
ncbi:MAG: hydantoinase B/oxoprolinase family protein [Thermoleophilaceae bacterium]